DVEPHVRTIGVGAAAIVSHQAEAAAHVRRGRLSFAGEPVEPFQAPDVAVHAIEHADLARRTEPEATGEEIAGVERDAEHQLRVPGEVHPGAHPDPHRPSRVPSAAHPPGGGSNAGAPGAALPATPLPPSPTPHARTRSP